MASILFHCAALECWNIDIRSPPSFPPNSRWALGSVLPPPTRPRLASVDWGPECCPELARESGRPLMTCLIRGDQNTGKISAELRPELCRYLYQDGSAQARQGIYTKTSHVTPFPHLCTQCTLQCRPEHCLLVSVWHCNIYAHPSPSLEMIFVYIWCSFTFLQKRNNEHGMKWIPVLWCTLACPFLLSLL